MYAHEQTHWWYVGMRAIAAALLDGRDRLRNGGPWEILDAGCGTGAGLLWLADYGRVTGLDLSGEALAYCRRRGLGRLVRGSIERLPFADESFDLATSFDVLYHRWVGDDGLALRELRRVLRPGGWLLLRVPALPWLAGRHDAAVYTRHRYRLAEVMAGLTAASFTVERATYANCLLLPLVAAKRSAERWTAGPAGDLEVAPAWLNTWLTRALRMEARLLRHVTLPWGVSALALARRR
ncbi:MAG: class I SAM-dependent methyltransferase [Chloroflexi bacterium]|nr:class I SAM-dependent methyltransferase [Chloroflexota bacterium]